LLAALNLFTLRALLPSSFGLTGSSNQAHDRHREGTDAACQEPACPYFMCFTSLSFLLQTQFGVGLPLRNAEV